MKIGAPKEIFEGEARVALTPESALQLQKLDGEELKFATGLSKRLGVEQFETLNKLINLVHYHIERNANPKILLMSTSFKIASVFKGEEVEVA